MLKKVGSNFVVRDRTLCVAYSSPFGLVAQTTPKENWLPLSDELRTYFERSGLPLSTSS